MKKWLRRAAAAWGVAIGLFSLTPWGPALLAHLLERGLLEDWRLSIGDQTGGLLYGFSFLELHCQNPELGLDIGIERLSVRPWSWAVAIEAPKIQIEPVAAAPDTSTAAANIELPLSFLPDLSATAGELDWHLGESRLIARDWHAAYKAVDDTSGHLTLVLPEVQGLPLHFLTLDLVLSPRRINRGKIAAVGGSDSLQATLDASFSLGLTSPQPLQVAAKATVAADSLQGHLAAEIDGALTPLQLRGTLSGEGRIPALDAFALQGQIHADSTRFHLDSLLVSLLSGTLTGHVTYFLPHHSLQTELQGAGFDLSTAAPFAGRAEFDLTAGIQLGNQHYAADFTALLRDVNLIPDERFDIQLTGRHHLDGATQLALQSSPLDLQATGSSDLKGHYDLALVGALQAASFLPGAAPIAIAGQARPDTLALQLTSAHLPGELGQAFGPLAADLHLFANRHLAARLRLERELLVAQAAIDLQQGQVDTLIAFVNGLVLDRLIPGLDGHLNADLHGNGELALEKLHLNGHITTTPLEYAGWQSGDLSVDVTSDQGVGEGTGSIPGVNFHARLDTAGHLTAQADFTGTVLQGPDSAAVALAGTVHWSGPLAAVQAAQGDLALNSFLLRQGAFALQNRGPLAAAYRNGRLDLTAVNLQTPVGHLALSGWTGSDSLSIAAALPALTLADLVPGLSASGTGHLQVGGSFAQPTAQGSLTLADAHLDSLSLGAMQLNLALADSLVAEFYADAGMHLALTCPAAPLFGPGQAPARLAVAATAADLGPVLSYALGQPLHGQLDLDGHIEGTLGDSLSSWREWSGHIDIHGLAVRTRDDADSLRLALRSGGRFELRSGQVALDSATIALQRYDRDLLAMQPAGILRLAGQLATAGESQLGLTLEDADLAFFGGPKGLAQLNATVSGAADSPELAVELSVAAEDLGELRGRLFGDQRGGDWRVNWTTLLDDSLVVTGQVPWDLPAGTIALDKGWLEAHSDGIGLFAFGDRIANLDHLDGRVSADLRVSGLDSTLALQGRVGVEGLEFAFLDLKPIYAFPDGHLQFNGRQVELVGFAAEREPKRGFRSASLSGAFDLARLGDPRFDLQFRAERLTCYYEDPLQTFRADDIDLDLTFAGSLGRSELAGRIRLDKPSSEPVLVVFNAPPVPPPPTTLRDDFFENMALAVEVDVRGFVLDSELAQAQASGAVEIGGTFYKPLFQGDITVDEGRISLLNQPFTIADEDCPDCHGRVVFNSLAPTASLLDIAYDPFELNPELDLQAVTSEIQDINNDEQYEVTLKLQGRLLEVVPELSAVAPSSGEDAGLSHADIFNLLAFNTTSLSNLNYTKALGTAAGQLLSKQVEKVGLDEFFVLPSSTIIGTPPGDPALRVGKYFAKFPLPLWVRYEALLKEISSGEVRIEHKIKSLLTITGTAQSEYDRYGLGIGLKRSF